MPQGQHSPEGAAAEACDELTAKTLKARFVCFEPHLGQAIFSLDDIDFTSFSKRFSHFLQTYSYIGMGQILARALVDVKHIRRILIERKHSSPSRSSED